MKKRSLILLSALIFSSSCFAGDFVDRGELNDMMKLVAHDIEENFYDPALKGLDWQKLKAEAAQKIVNSRSNSEGLASINWLAEQLHDSGTYFIPPRQTVRSDFGFKAQAFGEKLVVYEATKGGAAEKAGLRPGDVLVAIENVPLDRQNYDEVMYFCSVLSPHKEIALLVDRPGDRPKMVKLTAKTFTSVSSQGPLDTARAIENWRRWDDYVTELMSEHKQIAPGVGYIRAPSFSIRPEYLLTSFSLARGQGALIIDVRRNMGGPITDATSLLQYLVEKDMELGTAAKRKKAESFSVKPNHDPYKGKVLVLADSHTGGTAEIFARFLQMTGRAVVVGDRTAGKVSYAKYFPEMLGAHYVVRFGVTVSEGKFTMADGTELENVGVTPDVPCVPEPAEIRDKKDTCLDRAIALAKGSSP